MSARMAACLLVTLILAAGPVAWAQAKSGDWTPKRFPNPVTDPEACGRSGMQRSWVCDPDQVLSIESRNVVEGILKTIAEGQPPYAKAPCGDAGEVGAQVAVAIMQSFSPSLVWGKEPERVAMEFAESLHNQWGVGLKECHNGALLFLSVNDRQVYISRGKGVVRLLTDRVLDRIIDSMKPQLRAGRYGPALEAAVVDIGLALAAEQPPEDQEGWLSKYGVIGSIFGGFAALAGWAAWAGHREQRKYNSCKAQLDKLRKDQARLREGGTFNPTSCPICLEDFDLPSRTAHVHGHQDTAAGAEPGSQGSEIDAERLPSNSPETEPLLNNLKERIRGMSANAENAGAGTSSSAGGAGPSGFGAETLKGKGAGSAAAGSSSNAGGRSSGRDGGAAAAPNRKPLVLPCKHQFCEQCISEWVNQKKTRCPVCRKSIADNDDANNGNGSDSRPRPPCDEGVETDAGYGRVEQEHMRRAYRGPYQGYNDPRYRQRGYNAEDVLRDELLFRLLVLRRRYPAYINDRMVRDWSDDVANGRELSASAWQSFQQADPAVRATMADSGSRGAGASFGGGSSSGGRGGSW